MTVKWDHYTLYTPPVVGLPEEMSRSDARLCFDDAVGRRDEREQELRSLLGANENMFKLPNLDGIGPARYADDLGVLNNVMNQLRVVR